MIKYFVDSKDNAVKFIERSRFKPSQIDEQDAVEYHDVSGDDDEIGEENIHQQIDLSGISMTELQRRLKIKMEQIDVLQRSVIKLNNRVGTEIILDGHKENDQSFSCSMPIPRYENAVNTLNYQIDGTFGKKIFFLTDVRNLKQKFFSNIN